MTKKYKRGTQGIHLVCICICVNLVHIGILYLIYDIWNTESTWAVAPVACGHLALDNYNTRDYSASVSSSISPSFCVAWPNTRCRYRYQNAPTLTQHTGRSHSEQHTNMGAAVASLHCKCCRGNYVTVEESNGGPRCGYDNHHRAPSREEIQRQAERQPDCVHKRD